MTDDGQERILLVDDEPNVLAALTRQLAWDYEIETATGGQQALALLEERPPFAVIVSDMRMPGMDGATLLGHARQRVPDTARVLLTGYADLQAAIAAVNQGGILRFLVKPCPPEVLTDAVAAGVEQNRLIRAERELLEQTLRGAVKTLADTLALADPEAFGHAERVLGHVELMLTQLEIVNRWPVEVAAVLYHLPLATLPSEVVSKHFEGKPLNRVEQRMITRVPQVALRLLEPIPRLESVKAILSGLRAGEHAADRETPLEHDVRQGIGILRIALDYDVLLAWRGDHDQALAEMLKRKSHYDRPALEAFCAACDASVHAVPRQVFVFEMEVGMVIRQDVRAKSGLIIMREGFKLTESSKQRLLNFAAGVGIEEPLLVSS